MASPKRTKKAAPKAAAAKRAPGKKSTARPTARKKPAKPTKATKAAKPTVKAKIAATSQLLIDAAYTGNLEVLRARLAAGSDVNERTNIGYTPLLLAAKGAFREGVDALLAAGADVNARLDTLHNALHLVIEHTKSRPMGFTVTLTRKGKRVTLTDRDEIRAATGGHPDDEYDDCVAIARTLIGAGTEVDAETSTKQTPLLFAAAAGTAEITELLLATKRVRIDAQDNDGLTPLHFASRTGHVSCVRALVRAGANVNIAENYGFTPLHEAAENNHEEVARALLEAGADRRRGLTKAFEKYPLGATPADIAKAKKHPKLVALLGA